MLEKYIGKYKLGLSLMNEEEYQEAYDEFTKLIAINPNDYKAHAYRGVVGAVFLNKDNQEIYQDLTIGIKSPYNIASRIYSLYSNICLDLQKIDKAIEYAQKAVDCDRAIDSNYILLIKYYVFEKDDETHLLTALDYLDDLLEDNSDDELLALKANVLIKIERFDEAKPIIDKLFFSTNNLFNAYILQGDNIFFNKDSTIEDYKLAISYYNDAINLTQNKEIIIGLYMKISDIYKETEEFEKIFDISTKINELTPNSPITILNNALALQGMNKEAEAIQLLESNLDLVSEDMYTSRHYLSLWYYNIASTQEQYQTAIKYALEGLKANPSPIFYSIIIEAYDALYNYTEMQNYAKIMIKEFPDEAYGFYINGFCMFIFNKSFKQYYKYYSLAAHKEPSYYKDAALVYHDRTSKHGYLHRKNTRFLYGLIDSEVLIKEYWGLRLASIGHLYGTYGMDIDYNLAKEQALQCIDKASSPCSLSLYGATLVYLNERLNDAYELFSQAHNDFLNYKTTCSCGSSFLARMYLEGLYVTKDIEKAKKITLISYDKAHQYMHQNSCLLYAYFALNKANGFTLDIALKNLLFVEKEQYYNSPTYYLIAKIYEAKNQVSKAKYYFKKINKSLKYEPLIIQKYMKIGLKEKDLFLPPFNNF